MSKTKVTPFTANVLLGKKATWELQAIVNALSGLKFFNTPEEDQRLEAAKLLLELRKAVK